MLAGILNGDLRLVHVSPNDDDEPSEMLIEQVTHLFESQRVHLHSNYDEFLLFMDSAGSVLAAVALALTEERRLEIELSVATDPSVHRRGLARRLTQEALRHGAQLGAELEMDVEFQAYVVNPAMPALLASLGFTKAKRDKYWRLRVMTRR